MHDHFYQDVNMWVYCGKKENSIIHYDRYIVYSNNNIGHTRMLSHPLFYKGSTSRNGNTRNYSLL